MGHSKLSPSSAKRWMNCPGSIRLTEELNPPRTTNKYADEGTAAHEVHELCLTNGLDASDYLGKSFTINGTKYTVTQEMANAVQVSLDYVRVVKETDTLDNVECVEIIEEFCSLKTLGVKGLDGGTTDYALYFIDSHENDVRSIHVHDYKHGQGVLVSPINNPQAMQYALGIILKIMLERPDCKLLAETPVIISIAQPRVRGTDEWVKTWETTAGDLLTWSEQELIPAAEETSESDARLVPGNEQCKFCPVSGNCPALYEKTQELAVADFKEINLPEPAGLTHEQKLAVAEHADAIRGFLIAVEKQIKLEMDGGAIEYKDALKLVRKKTHRKFVEDAFDEDFSPLFEHLDRSEIYKETAKSLTEIEKELKGAVGADKAKEIMGELTTKPEGEIVVASISDKRMEVQPSVVSDFKNLDED